MTDLVHEELHRDYAGIVPDSWDPEVDRDQGDPLSGIPSALLAEPTGTETRSDLAASANPSGLSDEHRVRVRDFAVAAGMLAYHNRDAVHYSQNAVLRWTGINHNLKAYRGEFAHNYDCSSYATWCLWNGLDHFDVRDVVNDLAWRAGYTGTMLKHGAPGTEWVMRGDLVIYGTSWPGRHVAMCIGGGLVLSHGSERGPLILPINYRADVMTRRRYI